MTATLANHWAKKGWEVVLVTVDEVDRDFYTLDSGIRRIPLGMAVRSRHSVRGFFNNIRRIRRLWSIVRCEQPDVAVAMMATANAMLAIAGRLAGVPTVGSERIYPPAVPLGRLWETVRKRTYPLLSGVVAQTRESAAWLRDRTAAPYVAVIPNPVEFPLSARAPRGSTSKSLLSVRDRRVLLSVGRLEQQKGFDRLLTAFSALSDRHPEWVLVVLGQGGLDATLKSQAAALGLAERVVLPGAVGNVGEWYEAADLYALTSRFEGFPNTLLEAMAYGVPAVAVDCETGPREIVRHEVDGLLVPQNDPEALVAGLERLMSDQVLREQFAGRASEVRERFAVERIAGEWEVVFGKVVSEK